MPIDPRIAAGVQPIQMNDPMQTLMQVASLQQMKQNQQYQAERIELQRQEEERLRAAAQIKLREDQTARAARGVVMPGILRQQKRDELFATIQGIEDPDVQAAALGIFTGYEDKQSEINQRIATTGKNNADVQQMKLQQIANLSRGVRDVGKYEPAAIELAFRTAMLDDDTGITEQYYNQWKEAPEIGKPLIDFLITQGEQNITLNRGDIRATPTGTTVAQGLGPEPTQPQWVERFDPQTGRTTKTFEVPKVGDTALQEPSRTDPVLAELRRIQLDAARAGRSPGEVSTFNQIAGGYERSPLIRGADRTITLQNAINNVRADPSNPASQLDMAYAYIQASDTYQSAVREGELGLLREMMTRVEQLRLEANKVYNSGAILSPDVANQLADNGAQLIRTINEGANRKQKEFGARARASGKGVGEMWDQFVGGMPPIPGGDGGGASRGMPKVGDVVTRPNGQKVKITGFTPDGQIQGEVVP